jgi:hypothetical protein
MNLSSLFFSSSTPIDPLKEQMVTTDGLIMQVQALDLRRITCITRSRDIATKRTYFLTEIQSVQSKYRECVKKCDEVLQKLRPNLTPSLARVIDLKVKHYYLDLQISRLEKVFKSDAYYQALTAYQRQLTKCYDDMHTHDAFYKNGLAILQTCDAHSNNASHEIRVQDKMLVQCLVHLLPACMKKHGETPQLELLKRDAQKYLPKTGVQTAREALEEGFELITLNELQPHFCFMVEEYAFGTRFPKIYTEAMEIQKVARKIQNHGVVCDRHTCEHFTEVLTKHQEELFASSEGICLQVMEAVQYAEALKQYLGTLRASSDFFEGLKKIHTFIETSEENLKEKGLAFFDMHMMLASWEKERAPTAFFKHFAAPMQSVQDIDATCTAILTALRCTKTEPIPERIQCFIVLNVNRNLFCNKERDPALDLLFYLLQDNTKQDNSCPKLPLFSRLCTTFLETHTYINTDGHLKYCADLLRTLLKFTDDNRPLTLVLNAYCQKKIEDFQAATPYTQKLIEIVRSCFAEVSIQHDCPTIETRYIPTYSNLLSTLWDSLPQRGGSYDTDFDYQPESIKYLMMQAVLQKALSGVAVVGHVADKVFCEYVSNPLITKLFLTFYERTALEFALYTHAEESLATDMAIKQARGEKGYEAWRNLMVIVKQHQGIPEEKFTQVKTLLQQIKGSGYEAIVAEWLDIKLVLFI